jgi:hypothetical protein
MLTQIDMLMDDCLTILPSVANQVIWASAGTPATRFDGA